MPSKLAAFRKPSAFLQRHMYAATVSCVSAPRYINPLRLSSVQIWSRRKQGRSCLQTPGTARRVLCVRRMPASQPPEDSEPSPSASCMRRASKTLTRMNSRSLAQVKPKTSKRSISLVSTPLPPSSANPSRKSRRPSKLSADCVKTFRTGLMGQSSRLTARTYSANSVKRQSSRDTLLPTNIRRWRRIPSFVTL